MNDIVLEKLTACLKEFPTEMVIELAMYNKEFTEVEISNLGYEAKELVDKLLERLN